MIKKAVNRYLVDGLSGMALGLFATLIIGLIIKQIGQLTGAYPIGQFLKEIGSLATVLTGAGIGVGVAHKLGASPLVIYSSLATGMVGAYASAIHAGTMVQGSGIAFRGPGEPLGAYIAVIIGIECSRFIAGKTRMDIILSPLITIFSGSAVGLLIGPSISGFMHFLGTLIETSTRQQPFLMGILVATLMGILLTLPISSAALSIILGLNGLAAGAATVGCATQMIGFAVMSYKENGIGGLFAQGLGTSMLQVPNIVKNPRIWIPPILVSGVLGPLATMVFQMENNAYGGGMGTSGLVGQLMTYETMVASHSPILLLGKILLLHFILPGLLTWIVSLVLRKKGLIREGDLRITL